jgi:hypothetical protein
MIKIEFEVDEKELWSTVFGSNPFSFGDHFTEAEYLGDADWENVGQIEVTGEDENGSMITKILDVQDLANALPIANQQVYMDLFNFDKYDSICADAVLQVAMFGKVIYG